MKEMVGGCCVCSDDRGWPENPLVYCDGQSCTVAVHQACYGIVTVPTGPWFCRKCESQDKNKKVKCELCPCKYGALKRTDNQHWAHVVCALYIPEVRFGNVTTMEPIQLQLIPAERFNKVCYICEERGKHSYSSHGACMQCNKAGCKQQFHVTCGQTLGLLCEEAGNYLDNVKYCGYCQYHFGRVLKASLQFSVVHYDSIMSETLSAVTVDSADVQSEIIEFPMDHYHSRKKTRKGGHVKTIPPYKPLPGESETESDKETDASTPETKSTASSVKSRRSAATSKSHTSKTTTSTSKSSTASSQKTTSQPKSTEKSSSSSSKPSTQTQKVKTEESVSAPLVSELPPQSEVKTETKVKSDVKETAETETKPEKESLSSSKGSKKRKGNSRTPTPISVVPPENISVVINSASIVPEGTVGTVFLKDKRSVSSDNISDIIDKSKKAKTESTSRSTPPIPPITVKISTTTPSASTVSSPALPPVVVTAATTEPVTVSATQSMSHHSLVVSVPLHNTNLSPSQSLGNPVASVPPTVYSQLPEGEGASTSLPVNVPTVVPPSASPQGTMITTSDMNSGGLKISFEKQPGGSSNMMDLERIATSVEAPVKRSRSQSAEKPERQSRSKKRSSNGINPLATASTITSTSSTSSKRSKAQATPPPQIPSTSFNPVSSAVIKDSPPSSPSDESMNSGSIPRKSKSRKNPSSTSGPSSKDLKDTKDIKLFQNGVHAPHMLGNQLNPNSNMAAKMTDHLNSELEAHSIFNAGESGGNLVGPQMHHRVIQSVRARSSSAGGSSTASGGSGLSSMLGGNGGVIPQTLDQLLERQWEQGSQFLMEQAQHFDIASLLSCLHQLRAENLRLEEHVSSLLQRRDHLLAVNARLAIPLTGPPATPQSSHSHTAASHAEAPRSRHSGGYPSHGQNPPQLPSAAIENGLPPDPSQVYQHRSPATSQAQPSPNVRYEH